MMAELSCYDCIHCGACSDAGDSGYSCLKEDVSKCKHFKNKADFAEVKHGYWFDTYKGGSKKGCSVCHCQADLSRQGKEYCSHCGAKMDGGGRGHDL